MSLRSRNAIVPQMADYDMVGDQWVPYLMRFDHPLRNFPSVTTDEWGFRNTLGPNGKRIGLNTISELAGSSSVGVVLGSSAAFGVGATHDSHTIASVLNHKTDTVWLNFGGRALNSTQELILLMLHLPQRLDKIVVFSGVNNLTLAFVSTNPSPVYNSFFFQSTFEQVMKHPAHGHVGVRRAFGYLLKEIRHRILPRTGEPARTSLGDTYGYILQCFKRDARVLKAITEGIGTSVFFALQPLATWLDKNLAEQEQRLFQILDSMSMDWQVLARHLGQYRDRYFADMQKICDELSIPYYNTNLAADFRSNEWLFVDRVHLNDRGYEVAADVLRRQFSL